jgi:aspartyl-tRNA synthetase
MQEAMFRVLGFTDEDARYKFGFLMDAFEFGAPPHGGIAFRLRPLGKLFGGRSDIREFIAFPKNNAGQGCDDRCAATIHTEQLDELRLEMKPIDENH